jgi:probable phosphoglycerate mutase
LVEQIYLIRHGETGWSADGRHTGRSDVPLTERGERQAKALAAALGALRFSQVLVSPLRRARSTCALAGLGASARVDQELREWDYGEYEGLTGAQIRARSGCWEVFRDGCPGGESPEQVSARADAVLARLRALSGAVALFSHGHFLRALAVRWIELPVAHGRHFGLQAGALSLLGFEHQRSDEPAIELWNAAAEAR